MVLKKGKLYQSSFIGYFIQHSRIFVDYLIRIFAGLVFLGEGILKFLYSTRAHLPRIFAQNCTKSRY